MKEIFKNIQLNRDFTKRPGEILHVRKIEFHIINFPLKMIGKFLKTTKNLFIFYQILSILKLVCNQNVKSIIKMPKLTCLFDICFNRYHDFDFIQFDFTLVNIRIDKIIILKFILRLLYFFVADSLSWLMIIS